MTIQKIMNKLKSSFQSPGEVDSPRAIKKRQHLILLGGSTLVIFGLYIFFKVSFTEKPSVSAVKENSTTTKSVSNLTTPLKAVDEKEIWINRVEQKTEAVKEESQALRKENEFLQSRVDVVEQLLKATQNNIIPPEANQNFSNQDGKIGGIVPPQADMQQPYMGAKPYHHEETTPPSFSDSSSDGKRIKKRGSKIVHIKGGMSNIAYKTKDTHMPAGSYIKAVITGGAVVSTASSTQGNPEPITLRLVDQGTLPRGFKSRVKDAEVNASCYGSLSSERAKCRLETISWVEPDGQVVQKNLTGWIFGEDGRNGLRGEVVDRSTEVAKEAFAAGLLSATSQFFKMESTRGMFPTTPFGQTNALANKDALQGAAASGAGNAFDKIAEFAIKRAEQMQPVIVISSGRLVDLRLKEMLSLLPDEAEEALKVVSEKNQTPEEGEE